MIKFSPPTVGDLSAGVLVALVGIPQCLAYAMLSGLPPMYGLVTAAIPGIVAAMLGRSAHVTVGPTNTTGLVILTSLAPWADQPDELLTAMATLTVLAGLSRLAIVVFKAERIFDFVPEAVMLGFATGAALIIALMQVDEFVGVPFSGVRNVVDEILRLAQLSTAAVQPASIALALLALLSVVLGRRYAPRWPIALLTLLISVALVWFNVAGLDRVWVTLGASTTVNDGWPALASHLPSWAMVRALVIPGFAVAFIGSLELIVTLRNRQEQQWLSAELRSQGIANLAGSVVGAFPASTSLTRSVLLELGGARSRWAPLIAGVVLLPVILFGADLIRSIPLPVIAGLLVATAISMLKPKAIRSMLAAGNETRTLFIVTTAATLIISFHEAILLGAGIGIAMFLIQTSQPRIRCLALTADGWLHDRLSDADDRFVIQVSGDLYFAAARQLPERLDAVVPSRARHVTVDLNNAHHARVAAVQALQRFVTLARARGVEVGICGHTASLARLASVLGIALPWLDSRVREQLVSGNPQPRR